MSHKKFGPDRFSRFDVYWIQTNKQTNKQTNRQTDKPNLYIDWYIIRTRSYKAFKGTVGNRSLWSLKSRLQYVWLIESVIIKDYETLVGKK